jgi:hypothetical protein
MGIFGANKGDIELKEKARQFINNKRSEIVSYFNSFNVLSQPNDPTQNQDKAIDRVYYEEENGFKYIYHIFNIPGVFRMNNGLFQMIGENLMIFQLFFNKYSHLAKEELKEKFDEFFNSLLNADNGKINDMLKINIEKCELIKKKQGLEFLMDMFGDENIKSYLSGIFAGGIAAAAVTVTGVLVGGSIAATITAPIVISAVGVAIAIGIIAFFIYRSVKNNHSQKVSENFLKIKKFFEDAQQFLSSGVHFFCSDGDKNLFIIAIKKQKDLIEDICILPFNLEELKSTNCPTLGNNHQINSNSEYYKTILDACNFYINKYSEKVHNHMLNPNYALQKELENELNWLRTAKMEQIQNKIYAADNQKINDIKKENYAFELPKPPNYLINDNNSGHTANGNNYNNFSKRNQDGLILI